MAFPSDQEMQALDATAYCGYNLLLPEGLRRQRLRELIEAFPLSVPCVAEKWQIVWGPADFHSTSQFRRCPHVRGTELSKCSFGESSLTLCQRNYTQIMQQAPMLNWSEIASLPFALQLFK